MNTIGDIREYIEAIDGLIFEQRLNKENKKVARVLLHVKTAKEIIQYCDNPRVINRWYLVLRSDYDKLCTIVFENIKKRQAREEARRRPVV